MKKIKITFVLLLSLLVSLSVIGCSSETETGKSDEIVIIYTNDVHCAIESNIGYAGLSAYKKQAEAENKNVALVDAGDAIQGDSIGLFTKGEAITNIMNAVGYDLAIPGNHEVDYHVSHLTELAEKSDFEYLSANIYGADGERIFKPYKIMTFGDKSVAFIGITTPTTFYDTLASCLKDENGDFICNFGNYKSGEEFYADIQSVVDEVKAKNVDYVIVLGHLGIEAAVSPYTSTELIENTTGIDVLIDGHSHSVVDERVKNKDGETVILTQTGSKFENIGVLRISPSGTITNELISSFDEKDEEIIKVIDGEKADFDEILSEKVGYTDYELTIYQPDTDPKVRIVRNAETNLGDLVADAFKAAGNAEISVMNAGGIRASIEKGDILLSDVVSVSPLDNKLAVIEVTGQQLLDLLESGACACPEEFGSFYQVSGITYEIHTYIPCSIIYDENEEFVCVSGEYRVKNVYINGEPLDLSRTYSLAGTNYVLTNKESGRTMLNGCKELEHESLADREVVKKYISETLGGVVREDYSNPFGQGRIVAVEDEQ